MLKMSYSKYCIKIQIINDRLAEVRRELIYEFYFANSKKIKLDNLKKENIPR